MPIAGYPVDRAHHDNDADHMIERDSHGHLVLRAPQQDGRLRLLNGYGGRPG